MHGYRGMVSNASVIQYLRESVFQKARKLVVPFAALLLVLFTVLAGNIMISGYAVFP